MPVPGPARPLLRLPGAHPGRTGPPRREGGLHRRPRPGPGRPAGQAAHPGPGRDRRVRAGQDRRTVPAGQAVPRPRRRGDFLEGTLRLPARPTRPRRPGTPGDLRSRGRGARRIFADRAAGTTIRQICRQLNADAVPTPTGSRSVWDSTLDRLLRNEAYIGRTYFNRTETVPDRRPGHHSRQVPRPRADSIAIPCPAVIADETFQAAAKPAPTTPNGARATPNPAPGCSAAWSNAGPAASAPAATRCAAATAPGTGTTTATTTTRCAPAARTGAAPTQHPRRRPG